MNKQIPNRIEEVSHQVENSQEDMQPEMWQLFSKAVESLKKMDTDPEFREYISKRIS
jgi:hypothetical protein